MSTQLDDQVRRLLREEARAARTPSTLWDSIEARLDREPLRVVPRFRLPIDRPWRAAVAVCSVAAALWFCVVPDRFMARVQEEPPAATSSVAPVVQPYKGEVVKETKPSEVAHLFARRGGPATVDTIQ